MPRSRDRSRRAAFADEQRAHDELGGLVAIECEQRDGARYRGSAPAAIPDPDFASADARERSRAFTQIAKPFNRRATIRVYKVGVQAQPYARNVTAGRHDDASRPWRDGRGSRHAGTPFRFAYPVAPADVHSQRPVTYLCEVAGTLLRYQGYESGKQANVDYHATARSGHGGLMANQVQSCAFTYDAGTPESAGLVSLESR